MSEPSLQYQHLQAWNRLQERMNMIAESPGQFWSGRITAYYRMRFEVLSALFWAKVKP